MVSEGFRVEHEPAAGHRSELSFCDASLLLGLWAKEVPTEEEAPAGLFFFSEVQGGVLLAPATPNVGGGCREGKLSEAGRAKLQTGAPYWCPALNAASCVIPAQDLGGIGEPGWERGWTRGQRWRLRWVRL